MDAELQKFLEQMEARLGTEIQQVRTEVQDLRTETRTQLQEVRTEIQHAKDESIASAREMQTEVIRYIANVAEPFNVRMRHLEANCGNLDTAERLRLAALEERLLRNARHS